MSLLLGGFCLFATGSRCVTLASPELTIALGSLRATDTWNYELKYKQNVRVQCARPDLSTSGRSHHATNSYLVGVEGEPSLPRGSDTHTHTPTHSPSHSLLPESHGSECSSLARSEGGHTHHSHANLGQILKRLAKDPISTMCLFHRERLRAGRAATLGKGSGILTWM